MDSVDDFFESTDDSDSQDFFESEDAAVETGGRDSDSLAELLGNPEGVHAKSPGLRGKLQIGQTLLTQLDGWRERGRIPHAICFSGLDLDESIRAAFAFAQDLLCERVSQEPNSIVACGVCGSCLRVAHRQSESIRLVVPEKDQIKVSDVREVLNYLSLARDEKARFIIIQQAHLMNAVASNAFLKTLEEPASDVYFILVVQDPNSLLPTVRSRVQVVKQTASSWTQILKLRNEKLLGETVVEKHWLLDFWQDEQFLLRPDWKEFIKDKVKFHQVIRLWILTGVEHVSGRSLVRELEHVSQGQWLSFLKEILQVELNPRSNEDPVLYMESLWIRMRGSQMNTSLNPELAVGS